MKSEQQIKEKISLLEIDIDVVVLQIDGYPKPGMSIFPIPSYDKALQKRAELLVQRLNSSPAGYRNLKHPHLVHTEVFNCC